jgi:hypothetical protein
MSTYMDETISRMNSMIQIGRVEWSDGINSLFMGSELTDAIKQHIEWRKQRYADIELTYRVRFMTRKELEELESK